MKTFEAPSLNTSLIPSSYPATFLGNDSSMSAMDIDPEVVRVALRDFVTSFSASNRERDEAVAQLSLTKAHLLEMEAERDRLDAR